MSDTIINIPSSIQEDSTNTVDFTAGDLLSSDGSKVVGVSPSDLPISDATQTELDGKIESVVAGTNVTVDNTDPLNPVINAEGGDIEVDVSPITGGTDGRVLFQKAGKVSQSADFTFNPTTKSLKTEHFTSINSLAGFSSGFEISYGNGTDAIARFEGDVGSGEVRLWTKVSYYPTIYSNGVKRMEIPTSGGVNIYAIGSSSSNVVFNLEKFGSSASLFKVTGDGVIETYNYIKLQKIGSLSTFIGTGGKNENVAATRFNVGIGTGALNAVTTGNFSTAIGVNALQFLTSASYSTANGYYALRFSNGTANVGVGSHAGTYLIDGTTPISLLTNSTYVGAFTTASANNVTNENAFGYLTNGKGSNTVVIGNDAITHTYLKGQLVLNAGIKTSSGAVGLNAIGNFTTFTIENGIIVAAS